MAAAALRPLVGAGPEAPRLLPTPLVFAHADGAAALVRAGIAGWRHAPGLPAVRTANAAGTEPFRIVRNIGYFHTTALPGLQFSCQMLHGKLDMPARMLSGSSLSARLSAFPAAPAYRTNNAPAAVRHKLNAIADRKPVLMLASRSKRIHALRAPDGAWRFPEVGNDIRVRRGRSGSPLFKTVIFHCNFKGLNSNFDAEILARILLALPPFMSSGPASADSRNGQMRGSSPPLAGSKHARQEKEKILRQCHIIRARTQ